MPPPEYIGHTDGDDDGNGDSDDDDGVVRDSFPPVTCAGEGVGFPHATCSGHGLFRTTEKKM